MARWMYRRLRDLRFGATLLAVIFILGIGLGYVSAKADPKSANILFSMLKTMLKPILALKGWPLVGAIFLNNFKVCALLFSISLIFPYIVSVFGLFFNGFIVGLVLYISSEKTHSIFPLLFSLVPHGILELPAIFLASATGSVMGIELIRTLIGKFGWVSEKQYRIPKRTWIWGVIAVLMLIPAAIIEVFVSPKLLPH